MTSPEVVELDDPSALGELTRDWLELAARLDETLVLPDARLGAELVGDDRRADRRRGRRRGARPSGRLEALVALSRDRERLHRRLPIELPCTRTRAAARAPPTTAAGSCRGAGATRSPRGSSERDRAAQALLAAQRRPALAADRRCRPAPASSRDRVPAPGRCRSPIEPVGPLARLRSPARALHAPDGAGGGAVRVGRRPARSTSGCCATLFELHARARARHGASIVRHRAARPPPAAGRARPAPGRGPAAVVARRDGAVVGVLYGFWWRDTFAAYQWGWDPRVGPPQHGQCARLPGASALAAERGARTFDFLRGDRAVQVPLRRRRPAGPHVAGAARPARGAAGRRATGPRGSGERCANGPVPRRCLAA